MPLDRFGRNIDYLRISLTDKCNLRCIYCMPENMTFRSHKDLLQDDEILRLVRIFAGIGFHKFRLTGGEPTVRSNIVNIVKEIANTPGVRTVAMTTNGLMLDELAKPLAAAGLTRVNISIDTLNPEKFNRLTRWGKVEDVWRGLDAAEAAGLDIKFNAVIVRGYNDKEDVVDLARLTLNHPWQVRFIEMMPFGDVAGFQQAGTVSEEELRETISAQLGALSAMDNGRLDGEARLFKLPDSIGTIGFISSITKPFCAHCTRARLTADGRLRLCLLREKEVNLIELLRNGTDNETLTTFIKDAIYLKPWGHKLKEDVIPLNRVMSEIGG
ncbi:MAG: GTP 3',8-cyclase MoaA [Chloroflexi bacterium]|nr:MAG: GTP 3',8-cyclase MoaA [Chloroflexota bacterium]